MAHTIKVKTVPALNKDGSLSKTKKLHLVMHKGRKGGNKLIATATNKNELQDIINEVRMDIQDKHLDRHPNDLAFKRKHGLE